MTKPKDPPPKPWEEEPSDVIFLSSSDFKRFLKKMDHVLVMFYDPHCIHCKKTKPEFQKAAEELKGHQEVAFAAIDCTKYSNLCDIAGVNGYPTIKYYHYYNKEPSLFYSGDFKKNDFISFMKAIMREKKG